MAKPGLTKKSKFKRLSATLESTVQAGFGDVLAMGVLELLWHTAHENGEPYLGDTTDVEVAAHWHGRPGVLCQALLEAGGPDRPGFIEPAAREGTYQVHDFYDHCPDYIRKRLEREEARRAAGKTLSEVRAEAGRKGAEATNSKRPANGGQEAATDRQTDGNRSANGQQVAEQVPSLDRQTDGKLPALPPPTTAPPTTAPHATPEAAAGEKLQPDLQTIPDEEAALAKVELEQRLQRGAGNGTLRELTVSAKLLHADTVQRWIERVRTLGRQAVVEHCYEQAGSYWRRTSGGEVDSLRFFLASLERLKPVRQEAASP